MRRRSYLALAASALSTTAAGCTSSGNAGESTTQTTTETTTTETTTSTTATTSSASVSFSEVTLQPAALQLNTDYLTVHDNGQYLFALADVETGTVEYESYALTFAGDTYGPLTGQNRRRLWRSYNEPEYGYTGGLLVFQLPESTDATDPEAAIEYPGGEHQLDDQLRPRLAASPTFSAETSIPETVAADGSLAVELTVTNETDTPARFVGGLNRSGPSVAMKPVEAIRPLLAASETKTVTIDQTEAVRETPDEDVGDGEADIEFYLRMVTGDVERSVNVVDS